MKYNEFINKLRSFRPTRTAALIAIVALAAALLLPLSFRSTPAHYLALGDSYTIGESVEVSDRWPNQLVAALKQKGLDLGEPQMIAQTGWTTSDLLASMDQADLQKHYDWVTLMIGVNDQFRHVPIEVFRARLETLLDRSLALTSDANHVIVISIPDWGVTPFAAGADREAIAKDIDRFNAVYAEQVAVRHIVFVDVTEISREAVNDRTLIAQDGLHPSAKMYAEWVEAILTTATLRKR